MALPASAPTTPCTLSKPLMSEGTVGTIASANLSADRALVWAATGETIYGDSVPVTPLPDGTLAFNVIPTDADGVLDLAGNMVKDWAYTIVVMLMLPNNVRKQVTYTFQPKVADATFDLDLAPQTGVVTTPVTVVDGQLVTINVTNGSPDNDPSNVVLGTGITAIVGLTQASYDALATKDPTTLYVVTG